jgi:NAD(P)-dependent dehydrogenase (short-subunit alcohol dehydrogenase family)
MRSVVITGTSTGIGYAAAKVLLAKGFRVFGSVRKAADADRLKVELGSSFTPLLFDVTDEAAVAAAAREVRDQLKGETLAGLVNNAGVAVAGPALDVPLDDFRRQIDVNVMGPVIVSQAFGPLLGIDRSLRGPPGRIIMISSVAGRSGSPLNAPYALSKHALEGFSESLRRELMMFGIDVVIIGPGPIKTAIWEKAEQLDINAFGNSPFMPALQRVRTIMLAFGANGLPAERVGALIHKALTTPHPRVRYAIVPNPLQMLVARLLPKRVVDRIIARRLGLTAPRG